jgi:hypothetical protein
MADQPKDKPWSEAEWDAFLDRADFCSARYQELFETLADDPQRDQIIGREMGWDENEPHVETPWLRELEQQAGSEQAEDIGSRDEDIAENVRNIHAQLDAEDAALNSIPAYRAALAFGDAVRLAIMAMSQASDPALDDDLIQTLTQALAIAAKVAAGHAMGYHDEVLGGNIAQCRRAMDAAGACAISLQCIAQKKLLEAATATRLEQQLDQVRQALEARLKELRARVWW